MERGLAMAASADDATERESSPSSRSSSGCQSGWTLYLDHSNNNGARFVPAYGNPAAAQRWMLLQQADHAARGDDREDSYSDSMASDASSGPRPRPLEEDDDDARRDFGLRRHDGEFFVDQRISQSYSTTSGQSSGCFGDSSTWSRSSQGQPAKGGGGVARTTPAAVVFQGDATAARHYRELIVIEDDDDGDDEELDDTASSSAVFSCPIPMLHAR